MRMGDALLVVMVVVLVGENDDKEEEEDKPWWGLCCVCLGNRKNKMTCKGEQVKSYMALAGLR